jgi:hypothetical protein
MFDVFDLLLQKKRRLENQAILIGASRDVHWIGSAVLTVAIQTLIHARARRNGVKFGALVGGHISTLEHGIIIYLSSSSLKGRVYCYGLCSSTEYIINAAGVLRTDMHIQIEDPFLRTC